MISGIQLNNLTPSVLVGIAVIMIFLGWLVPRSILRDKERECERWRKIAETERESRATSDSQTRELLEFAKASYAILEALDDSGPATRSGGAHRVVPTSR